MFGRASVMLGHVRDQRVKPFTCECGLHFVKLDDRPVALAAVTRLASVDDVPACIGSVMLERPYVVDPEVFTRTAVYTRAIRGPPDGRELLACHVCASAVACGASPVVLKYVIVRVVAVPRAADCAGLA